MQRIDASALYTLGHEIHKIYEVRSKIWEGQTDFQTKGAALYDLRPALDAVIRLIFHSVFPIKIAQSPAKNLINQVRSVIDLCERSDGGEPLHFNEFNLVTRALNEFEAVLKAELATLGIFLVAPKNAMDTLQLIESGENAFPPSLSSKIPEAVSDVRAAMRCIAFELPTAAAFHLHRINETVLRRYWSVASGVEPNKNTPMGQLVKEMDDKKLGREEIRSALRDIVKLHRNPTIHPQQSLDDVEEAINLYGAIRSVVGFMLKDMPEPT